MIYETTRLEDLIVIRDKINMIYITKRLEELIVIRDKVDALIGRVESGRDLR